MRIDLYTITWNDRRILSHFLAYYATWVDRIFVFDDRSDDGTRQVLAAHPKVVLRDLPAKEESFVETALNVWNHAWKESRDHADWVIMTNVDEFFVHPTGAREFLAAMQQSHHTVIHPRGFEMYGDAFPDESTPIVAALPNGAPMFGQDKMQVFNPNAIAEMRFSPGRHTARPQGRVKIADDPAAALLHYKYVDTENYLVPRQRALGERMLPGDLARGYGAQYRLDVEQVRAAAQWLKRHSAPVAFSRSTGQRLIASM